MNKALIDITLFVWGIFTSFYLVFLSSKSAYAFTKLTNGFQTITETYLIPLSSAVAGASFILFVILSYFRQEEYQKKVGNVLFLSISSAAGLDLVTNVITSFS